MREAYDLAVKRISGRERNAGATGDDWSGEVDACWNTNGAVLSVPVNAEAFRERAQWSQELVDIGVPNTAGSRFPEIVPVRALQ